MNGKKAWTIGWSLVLSSFLPGPVGAVTISYDGVVTFVDGPHAAVFPRGEPLTISYTLDPLVPDSSGDPQTGIFESAVLSLFVFLPGIGVFVVAGPAGTAQTFDNVVDAPSGTVSDQVFIFGRPVSATSLLGGEPVTSTEVDFLTDFVAPPAEPMMLASDALPLFELPLTDAMVSFVTDSGRTHVRFAAPTGDATPTAMPTSTATATPKSFTGGDGCAIDVSHRTVFADAWLVLLGALLLRARRRQ